MTKKMMMMTFFFSRNFVLPKKISSSRRFNFNLNHPKSAFFNSRFLATSPDKMPQVDVEEEKVKKRLGNLQMNFVKKAERDNKERASRHVRLRRTDWMIGGTCVAIAIIIYSYTIFAMKQETFLDDFEMPDPLPDDRRLKK